MEKCEEDIYVFDIEMEKDDHVRLANEEMDRRKEERKSRPPLAVKAQKKALGSKVQDVMEFTRQSSALTISDEMPQKTVTHLEESTQSSGNRLGAFEDTLMEDAEQVPSSSETAPFPHVELFTERTSDTRHASAGANELTNEWISMLGEMGDVDSVSLLSLSTSTHKPAAVDIVSDDITVSMDTTINAKSCPDSAHERYEPTIL